MYVGASNLKSIDMALIFQNWVGGINFKDPNEGTGHMYDISVSAFDPCFWIHHW